MEESGVLTVAERGNIGQRVGVIVIHGVGDTETGWINKAIVEPLEAKQGFMAVPHSELHSLPDFGSEHKGARFDTLLRRAEHGDRKIVFAEFVWADLSRLGRGSLTLMIEALKVSMEAPDVLAHALLRNRQRGVFWLISLFVFLSSRLLKWFVVGLNTLVITSALWLASVLWVRKGFEIKPLMPEGAALEYWLEYWLLPPILLFLIGGSLLFYRRRDRDIGASDFGCGCAIAALVVLAYFVLARYVPPETHVGKLLRPENHFDNGRRIVFGFWALWCFSTIMAILLLALVWLARTLGLRSSRPVPLAPVWVGMFNILMQAIVVKLVMTPLSIMSCTQLNDAVVTDAASKVVCGHTQNTGVLAFALFETVFLVAALIWIYTRRALKARRVQARPIDVPRFIVHPLLIVVAALTVGAHILVFAGELVKTVIDDAELAQPMWLAPWRPWLGYAILGRYEHALLLLVPVYLFVARFVLNSSSAVIHIARDLVDHQYRARRSIAQVAQRWRRKAQENKGNSYPRRARIAGRLDTIMKHVMAGERLDKLIFLTHSQGSVIAFDFLVSDELCHELLEVGEIHVITLGSPLCHLYGYYFDEYERKTSAVSLRGNVRSWTNMWRIDDPIGNSVDVVDLVVNEVLPSGGHINYWREDDVRQLIADCIASPVARRYTPAVGEAKSSASGLAMAT